MFCFDVGESKSSVFLVFQGGVFYDIAWSGL